MSFSFASVEHFFASIAQDLVKYGKAIVADGQKLAATETVVEAVTGIAYPPAVLVERAAYATLGTVLAAVSAAQAAGQAGGVNIALDEAAVTSLKQVVNVVKANAAAGGLAIATPATPIAKA